MKQEKKNLIKGKVRLNDLEAEINSIQNEEQNTLQFPLNVFPKEIQEIVEKSKETLNYPIEFTASSILYATSIAVGNTHRVLIKNGFEQAPIIYLCLVAPSGSVKSHPLEFAIKPLQSADEKSFNLYKLAIEAYNKAKMEASKNKDESDGQILKRPFWTKYLISDYTPEALYSVHSNNLRSIGVYIDELAGWFKNFERYNKNSQQEFWLSAWSGKQISIDRKMTDSILITNPFISVAGTIQTALLTEITKENRGRNGFIDRILFVAPPNLQKQGWDDKEMPNHLIEKYHSIINKLLSIPTNFNEHGQIDTTRLRFSPTARETVFNWVNNVNTPLVNETQNDDLKGIYTKLEMYVPRFSLLLHLLEWASGDTNQKNEIGTNSVLGAIKLAEYFRQSAEQINENLNNKLENLHEKNKQLFDTLSANITTSEAVRKGIELSISESTVKRFLSNEAFFVKVGHGKYQKKY
jgi:Protein of unknown function (DUF3987)